MRFVCGVSLALLLAGLTHHQVGRWQSDRTLWCSAATLAPEKPRALNNCALALLRAGDYEAAFPLLEHAAMTLEYREPNRRSAMRTAVITNQFLVLYALRRESDARATLERLDNSTDPRVRRLQQWLPARHP